MRQLLLVALAGALLASCAGDEGGAAGQAPSPSPQATQPVVLDDLFEVEPGRRMHLSCVGSGSVAVLLEAGGGSGSSDWPGSITQPLSQHTRTCAYDRAGTGASDPPPDRPRTMADVGRDLDALLAAAGIQGKLLLVGASLGGQVALDWALHHPERTAGLVILDTDWPTADLKHSPDQLKPPAQRAEEAAKDVWNSPENTERIDHKKSGAETEAAFRPLPGIPIRILSAERSAECESSTPACMLRRALTVELQKQWLRLSPTAVQRVVDTGHNISDEDPDFVLNEILAALKQARP